jgi:hypothetical protein
LGDGAGAVYLRREQPGSAVRLEAVTDSHPFFDGETRAAAAVEMRKQLPAEAGDLLCDGRQNLSRIDAAETDAWRDWRGATLSPKVVLGEGSMAASAWQSVAAVDALRQNRYAAANVSVVGCNQQCIGARFVKA